MGRSTKAGRRIKIARQGGFKAGQSIVWIKNGKRLKKTSVVIGVIKSEGGRKRRKS